MKSFSLFPIHIALPLLMMTKMTSAFQTFKNKPCTVEKSYSYNFSTSLFVSSYQPIATTSDVQSSALVDFTQRGLLRHKFNDPVSTSISTRDELNSSTSRMLRTIPSGQKQLPLHIRIVKVRCMHRYIAAKD